MILRSWSRQRLTITLVTLVVSFGALAVSTSEARAQALPCGDIVAPEAFFSPVGDYYSLKTEAILDCNNPFNETTEPPSPFTLKIDGVAIDDGETYIQNEPIKEISIEGSGEFNQVEPYLFKHQDNNYAFVYQTHPLPTEEDYRAFADTYFATEAEVEQYLTILWADQETGDTDQYFLDDSFELLLDQNTGESISSRYQAFINAANKYLDKRAVSFEAGTYTMVIKESLLTVSYNSFWQDIQAIFIKTAHAQYLPGPRFYTVTFTIAEATAGPAKASSVLFLPGIQASRLYKDGLLGTED